MREQGKGDILDRIDAAVERWMRIETAIKRAASGEVGRVPVDLQTEVGVVLADARLEIELARSRDRDHSEFVSECVSDAVDPAAGVQWMRCSPALPEYVQGLEARVRELEAMRRAVLEITAGSAVAMLDEITRRASEAITLATRLKGRLGADR